MPGQRSATFLASWNPSISRVHIREEKLERIVFDQERKGIIGRRRLDDIVSRAGDDVRGVHADQWFVVHDKGDWLGDFVELLAAHAG
jgi:hypothetical protein